MKCQVHQMQGIEWQVLFPSKHHPLKAIQGLNEITHRRILVWRTGRAHHPKLIVVSPTLDELTNVLGLTATRGLVATVP